MQGLAINVKLLDQEGQEIDVSAISKQNEAEERKISKDLRDITSEIVIEDENERE